MTEQERRKEILEAEECIRMLVRNIKDHGDGAKRAEEARESLVESTRTIALTTETMRLNEAHFRKEIASAIAEGAERTREDFRHAGNLFITELGKSHQETTNHSAQNWANVNTMVSGTQKRITTAIVLGAIGSLAGIISVVLLLMKH